MTVGINHKNWDVYLCTIDPPRTKTDLWDKMIKVKKQNKACRQVQTPK